jgi:ribosomal protein L16 Arg81 hydroxylase
MGSNRAKSKGVGQGSPSASAIGPAQWILAAIVALLGALLFAQQLFDSSLPAVPSWNTSSFVPWDKQPPPHHFLEIMLGETITQDSFMDAYYEQKMLHTHSSALPKKLELTLDTAALKQLIENRLFKFAQVASVQQQEAIKTDLVWMAKQLKQTPSDFLASLLGLKRGNPSIVLDAVQHKATRALTEFAKELEGLWGVFPGFNIYVSPPGGRALGAHWDTQQDIFAVQLAGEKKWLCCDPSLLGLEKLSFKRTRKGQFNVSTLQENTEACQTLVLKPGDVLYMPSGFVHTASTEDSTSMHLTVAFQSQSLTVYDFARSFLKEAGASKCSERLASSIHDKNAGAFNLRRRFPLWELSSNSDEQLVEQWSRKLVRMV